ncbi:BrnA antitoxin family protein [Sulfitobacter sp. MF3-043]|uniref:BrnA antitoxin family protein n=1 Tax=Sulfitobacter sediminivivens TaxID=3252902 RepID=UPI0036DB937E
MTTPRISKSERIARERFTYHMWRLTGDLGLSDYEVRENVPDAWHSIEQDIDCEEPKEKVTLYLDRSVAPCFKAMGKGYQARINRLLQTWLQLRAAGMLETDRALRERMTQMDKGREER